MYYISKYNYYLTVGNKYYIYNRDCRLILLYWPA